VRCAGGRRAAGDALRALGIRSAYNGFSVAYAASNDTLDDSRIRTRSVGAAVRPRAHIRMVGVVTARRDEAR